MTESACATDHILCTWGVAREFGGVQALRVRQRVDIGTEGLNVQLRVDGLSGLAREMLAGSIGEAA